MEVWKAEDDCYYVRLVGMEWYEMEWYEVYPGVRVRVRPEEEMPLDDYMDRYVLPYAKCVQWDGVPQWVRHTIEEEL